ncbi:hypothetical protein CSAL01_12160 [Colletotrichum salicis]|uniref:DUF6594 domain-containing protein n=1 Tax=Colletotrichum salicis TaxID=1209931 RepID=A0A135UYV6_9PEZI|nr:hypothetical protein CSAL01_12160 [Colletotrichum salicis]
MMDATAYDTEVRSSGVENGNSVDLPGVGYGRLAKFLASSHENAIFRKFEQLNTMTLLRLQAELQSMEQELEEIQQEDQESGDPERSSYGVSFRPMRENALDGDSEQLELLEKIGRTLNDYNQALENFTFLHQASPPLDIDIKSLRLWLGRENVGQGDRFLSQAGIEGTVWDEEHRGDLLTVGGPSTRSDRLSRFINDKALSFYQSTLGHRSKDGNKVGADGIRHYDGRKVQRAGDIVVGALSAAFPTVAILVLYFVQNLIHRIGLVIVFTFIFSVAFAMMTGAKKAEVFAATAAFAAVEVVYIGSVASGDPICICSSDQA